MIRRCGGNGEPFGIPYAYPARSLKCAASAAHVSHVSLNSTTDGRRAYELFDTRISEIEVRRTRGRHASVYMYRRRSIPVPQIVSRSLNITVVMSYVFKRKYARARFSFDSQLSTFRHYEFTLKQAICIFQSTQLFSFVPL